MWWPRSCPEPEVGARVVETRRGSGAVPSRKARVGATGTHDGLEAALSQEVGAEVMRTHSGPEDALS
jgi:hypothetical protein